MRTSSSRVPIEFGARLGTVALAWALLGCGGATSSNGNGGEGAIVLFGGGSYLADTWEWNGSSWTQKTVANGPKPREQACMAPLGSKELLFGGGYGDTWEWDGSTWTQVATTGPSVRYGAACATLDGEVVLFGGSLGSTTFDD